MNNKGFTLTELLATIVILGVVALIAVPAVRGIANNLKEDMLEEKKKLILKNAKLYAEDNESSTEITVKDLCGKYITPDDGLDQNQCLTNPVNGLTMGDCKITISYNKGKGSASWNDSGKACN